MKIPLWLVAVGAITVLLVLGVTFLFIGGRGHLSCGEISPRPTIVAFGDSLISGEGAVEGGDLVSLLSKAAGVAIQNYGVSGDSTEEAKLRVGSVVKREPDIVIVLLGGNDALRNVPPEKTKENLTTIIREFKDAGAKVVLLGVRGGFPFDPFKDMFTDISKEEKTLLVSDVLSGVIGNPGLMSDSVHPNTEGYVKIAKRVLPTLLEACGGDNL